LGDPTAKERRRLTLNPIRHVDPLGTLIIPGALALAGLPVFGWAKPVPVNARRLRNPRFGMMAVAMAGPASNLVLAGVGAIALGLFAGGLTAPPNGLPGYFFLTLQYFILYNVFLALFNLLPIPPFDGSHIVEGLLPRRALPFYAKLRPLGFPLVFLLLVALPYVFQSFNPVGYLIGPPVQWLLERYLNFADLIASL
jgi:Zn-dependent protease